MLETARRGPIVLLGVLLVVGGCCKSREDELREERSELIAERDALRSRFQVYLDRHVQHNNLTEQERLDAGRLELRIRELNGRIARINMELDDLNGTNSLTAFERDFEQRRQEFEREDEDAP